MSPITNRCEPIVANRWCYKLSANGPTIGYQDPGAQHIPGCYHATLQSWHATGSQITVDGYTLRCDSGSVGGPYPVPDNNCPVSRCGALTSSAQCTVTKVCANGRRLSAAVGLVPNVAYISGDYNQTVSVGQPQPSPGYTFTSWNANGATLQMRCENINNALQWRMVADGFCTADQQISDDSDPACTSCPNGSTYNPSTRQCEQSIPNNWTEGDHCVAAACEYDGQIYNNSVSCCQTNMCGAGNGYSGYGRCRQSSSGRWYIENFSCPRNEYAAIQCQ
jgi:hypothetical protein